MTYKKQIQKGQQSSSWMTDELMNFIDSLSAKLGLSKGAFIRASTLRLAGDFDAQTARQLLSDQTRKATTPSEVMLLTRVRGLCSGIKSRVVNVFDGWNSKPINERVEALNAGLETLLPVDHSEIIDSAFMPTIAHEKCPKCGKGTVVGPWNLGGKTTYDCNEMNCDYSRE